MHPSLRCCSGGTRTPLIKFLGKRSFPSTPDTPHPHPAAPLELKQRFSEFLTKMNSSTSSPQAKPVTSTGNQSSEITYSEFWEAPKRFWNPRIRRLDEAEMNAVMSGGASSYR